MPKDGFAWRASAAGPVFVFAEKDGYRFTGLRTESGADKVVVRLRRESEPQPPREPPARSASPVLARQREVARQVLEELWAAEDRDLVAFSGIAPMARVDLERAVTWSQQMGEHRDDYAAMARCEKARCLALEGDVDGAFVVLAGTRGFFAFLQILKVAEQFADTDPAVARRFIDGARRFQKDMSESEQATAHAKLGELLLRLGDEAEGRRLIESAAGAATRLSWTQSAAIAHAGLLRHGAALRFTRPSPPHMSIAGHLPIWR